MNRAFYQSKFDYYKYFTYWVIVIATIASLTYYISDCQLIGETFQTRTLWVRIFVIVPFVYFLMKYKKEKDYVKDSLLTSAMIHVLAISAIVCTGMLPDNSHSTEGYIIVQVVLFATGLGVPFYIQLISHTLFFVEVAVSCFFIEYESLPVMIALSLPIGIAIIVGLYFLQKLYVKHFEAEGKLNYFSKYDQLTGVYNRNILSEILDEEEKKLNSTIPGPVSIIVIDIDHFKMKNDKYGHLEGDKILKNLTDILKINIPQDGYVIRWGGEEFIIILPHTNLDSGFIFAEKLRVAVEKDVHSICPVTVSAGVALYEYDFKSAVDNADKALYRAKENGRNRVEKA